VPDDHGPRNPQLPRGVAQNIGLSLRADAGLSGIVRPAKAGPVKDDDAEVGCKPPCQIEGEVAGIAAGTVDQDNIRPCARDIGMNGASVVNLDGRTTQPTTFSYNAGNLTGHTGAIGLGGVARFDVFGGIGGSLLIGDQTLQYDVSRTLVGGSGWFLKGNIPPSAALFDLTNVSLSESPAGFTLSGDLGVTFEFANFLLNTPTDTLRNVGTFTFTGVAAVPEPSTIALLSIAALLPFSRRALRSVSRR
jgi:hypothetical protein